MQIEPSQFIIVFLALLYLGIIIVGGVLGCLVREAGYAVKKEIQPPEWRPTVSAPFRPSNDEISQVPDKCPACGADLSPYEVQWDADTREAYCPDCKFPLKRRVS